MLHGNMIRLFVSTIAATLAIAALPHTALAQTKVPIRIGVQPNILPEVILRAQKTLERKYGHLYDIQWIDTTHAAAAIEAMVADSMDITDAAALPLMQARERGIDIYAVADAVGDVTGIVVRSDSGIKTGADLKGKTLAFPGKGSLQQTLVQMVLEDSGVNINEVNLVRARFPEMPLLLEKKAVDGFAGAEPFLSMVLSKGEARLLFKASSRIQQKEGTMIVGQVAVRGAFARQHPEALKAFLKEFQEASRFIKSNPNDAAKIFASVFPGGVNDEIFKYALNNGLVYFHDVKPRKEDWLKLIAFSNKAGLTNINNPEAFLKDYLHPEFVAPW